MTRLKVDDTLSKLGDTFHYIIVLESCLDLNPGEEIIVEKYGDITKFINGVGHKQVEVKHHIDATNFSERSVDLWKTLKNWINLRDEYINFEELVLLTTSSISQDSVFNGWNNLDETSKVKILKKIGGIKKESEATFRPLYDSVFSNSEDDIKSIINKVKFYAGEPDVLKRKSILKNRDIFKYIDEFDIIFDHLMGLIITLPLNEMHNWSITYDSFTSYISEIIGMYTKGSVPLPTTYEDIEPETLEDENTYPFVREIRKIEYDEEIDEAIVNYWRANSTIADYFSHNPSHLRGVQKYQKELMKDFSRYKKMIKRQCDDENYNYRKLISMSKNLFDNVMLWPPRNFGRFTDNKKFFQHGIIHSFINMKTNWYLGDDET